MYDSYSQKKNKRLNEIIYSLLNQLGKVDRQIMFISKMIEKIDTIILKIDNQSIEKENYYNDNIRQQIAELKKTRDNLKERYQQLFSENNDDDLFCSIVTKLEELMQYDYSNLTYEEIYDKVVYELHENRDDYDSMTNSDTCKFEEQMEEQLEKLPMNENFCENNIDQSILIIEYCIFKKQIEEVIVDLNQNSEDLLKPPYSSVLTNDYTSIMSDIYKLDMNCSIPTERISLFSDSKAKLDDYTDDLHRYQADFYSIQLRVEKLYDHYRALKELQNDNNRRIEELKVVYDRIEEKRNLLLLVIQKSGIDSSKFTSLLDSTKEFLDYIYKTIHGYGFDKYDDNPNMISMSLTACDNSLEIFHEREALMDEMIEELTKLAALKEYQNLEENKEEVEKIKSYKNEVITSYRTLLSEYKDFRSICKEEFRSYFEEKIHQIEKDIVEKSHDDFTEDEYQEISKSIDKLRSEFKNERYFINLEDCSLDNRRKVEKKEEIRKLCHELLNDGEFEFYSRLILSTIDSVKLTYVDIRYLEKLYKILLEITEQKDNSINFGMHVTLDQLLLSIRLQDINDKNISSNASDLNYQFNYLCQMILSRVRGDLNTSGTTIDKDVSQIYLDLVEEIQHTLEIVPMTDSYVISLYKELFDKLRKFRFSYWKSIEGEGGKAIALEYKNEIELIIDKIKVMDCYVQSSDSKKDHSMNKK